MGSHIACLVHIPCVPTVIFAQLGDVLFLSFLEDCFVECRLYYFRCAPRCWFSALLYAYSLLDVVVQSSYADGTCAGDLGRS